MAETSLDIDNISPRNTFYLILLSNVDGISSFCLSEKVNLMSLYTLFSNLAFTDADLLILS